MSHLAQRPINRFDAMVAQIIGAIVCMIGIMGALISISPIFGFAFDPQLQSVYRPIGAALCIAGFLAIGTAGWLIARHYHDYDGSKSTDPTFADFRANYRRICNAFGAIVGIFAFLFCLFFFLAIGPSAGLIVLTATSIIISIRCYFNLTT